MATITYSTKLNGTIIAVPKLTRIHCDMPAFRTHAKYGAYANSDLFLAVLARIRRDLTNNRNVLDMSALPNNVQVNTSKFLAIVTIEV